MPPWILGISGAFSAKTWLTIGKVAGLLVVLAMVRHSGYAACHAQYARKAAQEAAQWAAKVQATGEQAYERGLQAARKSAGNEQIVKDIANDAHKDPDAGRECVSADTVQRLRDLQ